MRTEYVDLMTNLIETNGRLMAELACRCTGSRELAKDLVQESWLIAWCKIDQLSRHPKPDAWLFKTMRNLIKRELSKVDQTEVPLDEAVLCEKNNDLPMELALPDGLTKKECELILMRIDRRMSFSEIAEEKGISETACRQQVSRAIRKCRKLMEKTLRT